MNRYMDTYGTRVYVAKENDGFKDVCLWVYIPEVNGGFRGYARVYRILPSRYNNWYMVPDMNMIRVVVLQKLNMDKTWI